MCVRDLVTAFIATWSFAVLRTLTVYIGNGSCYSMPRIMND